MPCSFQAFPSLRLAISKSSFCQSSLMFASEAGAYTRVDLQSYSKTLDSAGKVCLGQTLIYLTISSVAIFQNKLECLTLANLVLSVMKRCK